jgi:Uma2 family endonuclease
MAVMKAERPRVSYADLLAMPDDGRRYEIIDGELFDVSAAPSPSHQRVAKRLLRQLEAYFEAPGRGEVFIAPVDVVLTTWDVFEPDLVVVTERGQVTARAVEGSPALVVEVLSPSTRSYDRTKKGRRYAALGISHFWVVDPAEARLQCYRLEEGAYQLVAGGQGSVVLTHSDFPGLTIDLAPLWAGPPGDAR